MLISHEVPLCMLEESRLFNDYDYALVHLFEKYEQYYNFFKQSLKQGRKVILDNSVFELETIFDSDIFAENIIKLQPTEYIIPDSLEDKDKTISSFERFNLDYGKLPGKKIGVVQGKNIKELDDCFRYMVENADKVAISFDYSCLLGEKERSAYNFMVGRIKLLNKLRVWAFNKPIHLLGCFLPQEFSYYRKFNNIETIDTSNPIVHGIKNIRYTNEGLQIKESIKLANLINIQPIDLNKEDIMYNIYMFRKFVRG